MLVCDVDKACVKAADYFDNHAFAIVPTPRKSKAHPTDVGHIYASCVLLCRSDERGPEISASSRSSSMGFVLSSLIVTFASLWALYRPSVSDAEQAAKAI